MSKDQLHIVKIGGNITGNEEKLDDFLLRFHKLKGKKIIVHGGGRQATELSEKLGIQAKMHEGRRITDDEAITVAVQVYAGLVNKKIVSKLQALGTNAIGLTGADMNLIKCSIRPKDPIDFGWVGDIEPDSVNVEQLDKLLSTGAVPVFCAITHDGAGHLLNTNADTIASALSAGMAKVYTEVDLTYCFEMPGVMRDIKDPGSLIKEIDSKLYDQLKAEEVVKDGMIPKLDNAFNAIESGVSKVHIQEASTLGNESGTTLIK
ncbi:acetylglutamate kinase [Marinigracilibium pacificum]|uniref:Acetylglutamate kinase n=1 Tax=Marinigracilibium pacificum TaxID=2729599 RepID=A0A848J3U8_9BACT|nr:acetylglutamate kinase [Marinigracilibium pacificum]NMM49029.1 acetylglutamate kinase [Marinigracilibium pacificum]